MGRTTALVPAVQEKIISAIRVGVPYQMAAAGAGIGEKTFYTWLEKGRAGKAPYKHFQQQVEKAKLDQVTFCLDKIRGAAGSGAWQAAAWMLERKYPKEFGRQMVEHYGEIRTKNEYVIAMKVAKNETTVEAVHRSIRSVKSLVRYSGGNGKSH